MTMKLLTSTATIMLLGCTIAFNSSCTDTDATRMPAGTIDGPITQSAIPPHVLKAIDEATILHQYEIMSDTANDVSVSCIGEADTIPTEGYGIVVVKGSTSTTFADLRNARQPLAHYDTSSGSLWLVTSAMEGTGVAVERLYQLRFDHEDHAHIAMTIDPYDMQQTLLQRLRYTIRQQDITLYDGNRQLCTIAVDTTDMGGLDADQPLWIGEQLIYDISTSTPRVLITPGVKFTNGPVLTYDDMPTLSAPISSDTGSTFTIGDLDIDQHPYEGTYLDTDNDEPNLYITYRRSDGRYDINIGIFRLTTLDDALGTLAGNHLDFTATDAAGNPIGGLITLHGDTAEVAFTRSTWPLLENGTKFVYIKSPAGH